MTDQDGSPINQEERIERLSVRILAGAKEIVARGDGRMFTMDQIRQIFPSINAQRLNDAIKTLKDNGSVYGIGKGVYEIAEAYPPARPVSVTIRDDGRRLLEIGDDIATLTPEEARRVGMMLGGDAVQAIFAEQVRLLGAKVWELEREKDALKQRLRAVESGEGRKQLGFAFSAHSDRI